MLDYTSCQFVCKRIGEDRERERGEKIDKERGEERERETEERERRCARVGNKWVGG